MVRLRPNQDQSNYVFHLGPSSFGGFQATSRPPPRCRCISIPIFGDPSGLGNYNNSSRRRCNDFTLVSVKGNDRPCWSVWNGERGARVDERTRELIAMGASAAVNCRPCMQYHLTQCRKAEASEDDIKRAVETGLQVNRGAASKTREYVDALISGSEKAATEPGCC